MADIDQPSSFGTVKYHDNGDGTYSQQVYAVTGAGSNSTQIQGASADSDWVTEDPLLCGAEVRTIVRNYSNGKKANLGADGEGNLLVSLATVLSQSLDSVLTYPRGSNYTNLSASAQVLAGAGKLNGVFCASTSGGTLKLWDSLAGSGNVLVNTFALVAGTSYDFRHARVGTGIYATITNTADITVFFDPTVT